MCNVRPEDSGEIKFIARRVESVAYLDVEGIKMSEFDYNMFNTDSKESDWI